MSAYWRWPGVWSISETSRTCGSSANSPNASRQSAQDDLAAHVDRVIGAQQAGVGCQLDRVCQQPGGLGGGIAPGWRGADAHRVEHGGRAGGRQLRVAGEHGVQRIPLHARPGSEVVLQVVGMQFDQARQQVVAAQVLAAAAGSGADVGDQAVADQDRAVR